MAAAGTTATTPLSWSGSGRKWFRASSVQDILQVLASEAVCTSGDVKFVNGNTSSGVFKKEGGFDPSIIIDIANVNELKEIVHVEPNKDEKSGSIHFGGGVTIEAAIRSLKQCWDNAQSTDLAASAAAHLQSSWNIWAPRRLPCTEHGLASRELNDGKTVGIPQ